MNIGEVARIAGLPVKTIRYYEEIGLIAPHRADNGYREFGDQDVDRLAFLARARGLGFSLEECRRLVGLYCDKDRASRDVRELALGHLAEIRAKIAELRALEATLQGMVAECRGNDDPDCAILGQLAGNERAMS